MTQYPHPQPSQGRLPPFSSFSFDSRCAFTPFNASDSFTTQSSFPARQYGGNFSTLPIPFSGLPDVSLSNSTYSVNSASARSALSNLVNMSAISGSKSGNRADVTSLISSGISPKPSLVPSYREPPPPPAQPPPSRQISTLRPENGPDKIGNGTLNLNMSNEKGTSTNKYRQRKLLRGRRTSPNSSLPCDVCNQLYSRKDNLRAHQRVHSGEKPYTCSECSVRFRWLGALRSHQASHRRRRSSMHQKSKMGMQRSYLRPLRLRVKDQDTVSGEGEIVKEGNIDKMFTVTTKTRDILDSGIDESGSELYASVDRAARCINLSGEHSSGSSEPTDKDPAEGSEVDV